MAVTDSGNAKIRHLCEVQKLLCQASSLSRRRVGCQALEPRKAAGGFRTVFQQPNSFFQYSAQLDLCAEPDNRPWGSCLPHASICSGKSFCQSSFPSGEGVQSPGAVCDNKCPLSKHHTGQAWHHSLPLYRASPR